MTRMLRVSILGALPNGEKWSVNPHFICSPSSGDLSYTQVTTIATAIAALTPASTLTGQWSTGTTLTGCRVEARSSSGALENVVERTKTTPVAGTGSMDHPYQTSVVLTLKTATAGASGRGRLYWPGTAITLDAPSLRIYSGAVSNVLAASSSYLTQILTAIRATTPESSLVVFSRTKNLLSLVNALSVGDIADVQRRRRDALVENVTTSSFAN